MRPTVIADVMRCLAHNIAFAALALLAAQPAAARDIATAAPHSLHFAVTRNGEPIGTHRVQVVDRGDTRAVTNTIAFAVTRLGLVVYRYNHQSEETWSGGRLQSLTARSNDDGIQRKVRVARQGEQLRIDREERRPMIKAAALEHIVPAEVTSDSETVPGTMLPTSMWNQRITAQSALINTHHGKISKFQVAEVGRETVSTSGGSLQATHYLFTGEIRLDLWFEGGGRWVKARFIARDGSTIEYTLQE